MSIINHIQRLREKHAQLEQNIHTERNYPQPNEQIIAELKHQKLKIKDEITTIDFDHLLVT